MQFLSNAKKYGFVIALTAPLSAMAQSGGITAEANTAITAAKNDATTVGGYVVAAIGALVVVSLVIGLIRKV